MLYWKEKERKITEKILEVLREKGELCIKELAKEVGISRNTLPRYLALLEGQGKVKVRALGPVKLYSVRE